MNEMIHQLALRLAMEYRDNKGKVDDDTLQELVQTVEKAGEQPGPSVGNVDDRLAADMRQHVLKVFEAHPDLRGIVCAFDFGDKLNDAPKLTRGIWVTRSGKRGMSETLAMQMVLLQIVEEVFKNLVTIRETMKQSLEEILTRTVAELKAKSEVPNGPQPEG